LISFSDDVSVMVQLTLFGGAVGGTTIAHWCDRGLQRQQPCAAAY
jgi:hypothetical protein